MFSSSFFCGRIFDVNFLLHEENGQKFAEKYFFRIFFLKILLFGKMTFLGPHRHFEAYFTPLQTLETFIKS